MKAFSIGHSTRSFDVFLRLLQKNDIHCLVDVRRFPYSPRQPHFNIESLRGCLDSHNIHYIHMEDLGGRRPLRCDGKPSQNTLWKAGGFRNYADYAETPQFHSALNRLLDLMKANCVAYMCAEENWMQCHRRIITDYLLVADVNVTHIMGDRREEARLTEGAAIAGNGQLLYSDMPLFGA